MTSDNKILTLQSKKCSRCKQEFDYIDANNHCVECWYFLLTYTKTSERVLCALLDLGSWFVNLFKTKNYEHKAQCLCEQCRGWIYRWSIT